MRSQQPDARASPNQEVSRSSDTSPGPAPKSSPGMAAKTSPGPVKPLPTPPHQTRPAPPLAAAASSAAPWQAAAKPAPAEAQAKDRTSAAALAGSSAGTAAPAAAKMNLSPSAPPSGAAVQAGGVQPTAKGKEAASATVGKPVMSGPSGVSGPPVVAAASVMAMSKEKQRKSELEGWTAHQDDDSGTVYYYNSLTGLSQVFQPHFNQNVERNKRHRVGGPSSCMPLGRVGHD